MAKTTVFDVLIVYSERLAASAGTPCADTPAPFAKGSSSESYNLVYAYFLQICRINHLQAAFTTSADITGAGRCQSYWIFERNRWMKVRQPGYSKVIFDKFFPVNKKITASRNLLFSSREVAPFNDPYLFDLFFDKQKTYTNLRAFSIPTVTLEDGTQGSIEKACKTLKELLARHPLQNDFSDEVIMKDRFGAGGIHVYKFKTGHYRKIMASMKKHQNTPFILQPFVKFDKGFRYQNVYISADIRLIYLGKKIIQTYIRIAKAGDFRCNEHQGGLLKYISKREVPSEVVICANKIINALHNKRSLITLDFVLSNNGNLYLLEGNTGPGLDWNVSIKENEIEAKKLIRIIVRELVQRVRVPIDATERQVKQTLIDTPPADNYPIAPTGFVPA